MKKFSNRMATNKRVLGAPSSLKAINRLFLRNAELADPEKVDFTKPKDTEFCTMNLNGEPTDRFIVYLRSDVGCSFGQKTGGCLACRHWRIGTAGYKLDIKDMYVKQVASAITGHSLPPVVNLYNEGNVLSKDEIPHDQLKEIVGTLSNEGVKRLVLESRPEYISPSTLGLLKKAAGSMEIEVGIGLEAVNETIRNGIFLKAMTLKSYERSIQRLNDFGMRSLAYVIIKPPFLTEKESIEEAISTTKYAFDVGTSVVSLEPIGVEPYTVTEVLHKNGLFQPAKLWSALHVLENTHSLGEVRVGGTQFAPRPETLPRNCDDCTDRIVSLLDQYNLTYDIEPLKQAHCSCKDEFKKTVLSLQERASDNEIKKRIQQFIATLPQEHLSNNYAKQPDLLKRNSCQGTLEI